jgi:hypothetical protein
VSLDSSARSWLAIVAVLSAATAGFGGQQLLAQELRGVVLESSTREPVRGAVLTLLDSSGGVIARILTDERGEYRVNRTSSMRRIRVVRIGFRPGEANVAAPASENARVDIAMTRISTFLEQVRVTARACPRRSNRGSAVALLDQARAGLLATVVAREANPAALVRLVYRRNMDGTSDRITYQAVQIDSSSRTTTSFNAARRAASFVRQGFMDDFDGANTFYAPDAETLLDDDFVNGYCFRVVDPVRARPDQVGVGFYAPDRKSGRVDIDGTLWIDTIARSLRDIEFRYVGLNPDLEALRPGGRIEFREMPNGVVLIDRWNLRLVAAAADSIPRADGNIPVSRLYATTTGGEVESARWKSGVTWEASLGTLRVRAVRRNGSSAAGTKVKLVDTPYRATVDTNGTFEIADLVPGPYRLVVLDPRLDSVGLTIPTSLRYVADRGFTGWVTLDVPTAEDFVIDRCIADKRYVKTDSLLLVRVMTADGAPVAGARIDVEVGLAQELSSIVATPTGGPTQPLRSGAVTGTDGVMAACSWLLRRNSEVIVKVRYRGAEQTVRQRVEQRLTIVKVLLDDPPVRPH